MRTVSFGTFVVLSLAAQACFPSYDAQMKAAQAENQVRLDAYQKQRAENLAKHANDPKPPAASESAASIADAEVTAPSECPDVSPMVGKRATPATAWLPTPFTNLTAGMSPTAVNKLFPGAANVDEGGASQAKAKDLPGVDHVEFLFAKKKLTAAALVFNSATSAKPACGDYVVNVLTHKYGTPADKSKEDGVTWTDLSAKRAINFGKDHDPSTSAAKANALVMTVMLVLPDP